METPHPGWVTIIQPGGIPPPWPHDTDISDVRIVLLVFVVPTPLFVSWTTSRSSITEYDLGGPPLGEACLDHCPQGDRVVDDQEDATMEQTNSVILLMTSFSFDRIVTE